MQHGAIAQSNAARYVDTHTAPRQKLEPPQRSEKAKPDSLCRSETTTTSKRTASITRKRPLATTSSASMNATPTTRAREERLQEAIDEAKVVHDLYVRYPHINSTQRIARAAAARRLNTKTSSQSSTRRSKRKKSQGI